MGKTNVVLIGLTKYPKNPPKNTQTTEIQIIKKGLKYGHLKLYLTRIV